MVTSTGGSQSFGDRESFISQGLPEKLNRIEDRKELASLVKSLSLEDLNEIDVSALDERGMKNFGSLMFYLLRGKARELLAEVNVLDAAKDVIARFKDIDCIKDTAIQVEGFKHPFLHANLVSFDKEQIIPGYQAKGEDLPLAGKILTQCPIGEEEGRFGEGVETQEMFWAAMIENSNVIVDLTRRNDPVAEYFPKNVHKEGAEDGQRKIGRIVVTCRQVKQMGHGIEVHHYLAKDERTGNEREITRIHYPNWTDFSGISDESLEQIEYLKALEDHVLAQYPDAKPTTVHCRAGVGRSGTYTAASAMIDFQKQGLLNKANTSAVVSNLILRGRRCRGAQFVQSLEQFQTLLSLGNRLNAEDLQQPSIDYEVLPPLKDAKEQETVKTADAAHGRFHSAHREEDRIVATFQDLANKHLSTSDLAVLESTLQKVNQLLEKGLLKSVDKSTILGSLRMLKENEAANWGTGYVWDDSPAASSTAASESVTLSEALKSEVNFTINRLESNVPEEVRKNPAFHEKLIQVTGKEVVKIAESLAKGECERLMLRKGGNIAAYLLRDSSTRTGPKGIQTFTMTYAILLQGETKIKPRNIRLAFNQRTGFWQLATVGTDRKGLKLYDLQSRAKLVKNDKSFDQLMQKLKRDFPDSLSFDNNGNLINRFKSMDDLIKVYLEAQALSLHADRCFPLQAA